MRILVTGNQGYIGTNLTQYLIDKGHDVFGLDCGYFSDCNLTPLSNEVTTFQCDIRDVEVANLVGFDLVVHLAALSNDPVGELDEALTYQINYHAAVRVCEIAKRAGVSRFVFVSTQSIYGISDNLSELDEDTSTKNPQTIYAKSKWNAEQEILSMSTEKFVSVAIRPSTVFGWGPRLRSDIVFNNLLLSGMETGKIEVHSDGSPWRPVVHIYDIARAVEACIDSPVSAISGSAFNIGVINGNYTVKELAEAANNCLGNIPIMYNTENIVDPRSYRVSFSRAREVLGFQAKITLEEGGREIMDAAQKYMKQNVVILSRKTNRLQQMKYLLGEGRLDESLRFRQKL